jgi:hypothetical protein
MNSAGLASRWRPGLRPKMVWLARGPNAAWAHPHGGHHVRGTRGGAATDGERRNEVERRGGESRRGPKGMRRAR